MRQALCEKLRGNKNMNPSGTVSIEREGNKYTGEYSVSKGMLTVTAANGSKTTQLGGSPPEVLARTMLGELFQEGKATDAS
jgi:hypothetical protein